MIDREVTIYISDQSPQCKNLLEQMDEWGVLYHTKNVSENKDYLNELQSEGVYGTPTLFIEGEHKPILGFQKNKIRHILGLGLKASANNDFREESD